MVLVLRPAPRCPATIRLKWERLKPDGNETLHLDPAMLLQQIALLQLLQILTIGLPNARTTISYIIPTRGVFRALVHDANLHVLIICITSTGLCRVPITEMGGRTEVVGSTAKTKGSPPHRSALCACYMIHLEPFYQCFFP